MKSSAFKKRRRKQLIFYLCIIIIPLLQFVVFYIGVNINSIILAFQSYDLERGYYFIGFDNFKQILIDFKEIPYLLTSIKNSLILYLATLLTMILSLLFSYYIFKRRTFGGFFKFILFLPNI